MNFTDWQSELEKHGYVVTEDTITTQRGDVLAGKDPYGGTYISDSRIQDIVSKKATPVKATSKKKVIAEEELEMVRARDKDGKFVPDNPDTPDVNEAWIVKTVKKVTKK